MSKSMKRRTFVKGSLLTSAVAAAALPAGASAAAAAKPAPKNALPQGKIGDVKVSRILLGGNLLTHYTHSRDLKYVYKLAEHYNTNAKIRQTLEIAETHGVNTLSIHTVPNALNVLQEHRKNGGKMQWIICPTAPVEGAMTEYAEQIKKLVDDGADMLYLWGVRSDPLARQGKMDLIAKAVDIAHRQGVPSGVGAHDLNVIKKCEENNIGADFYIKTLHHHQYPSAPRPDEIKGPYNENPGYWCDDPQAVVDFMQGVEKPWIAFKVMAAGAIPPANAFQYAFESGADFCLSGMFDFEIAEDVKIACDILAKNPARKRPWRA